MGTLIVPNRFAKGRQVVQRPRLREDPGRPAGRPKGSHIDNLVALHKAILLCWRCDKGFNERRHSYYRASGNKRRIPHVIGKCDACRTTGTAALFVHESTLVQGGRSRAGQSWRPD